MEGKKDGKGRKLYKRMERKTIRRKKRKVPFMKGKGKEKRIILVRNRKARMRKETKRQIRLERKDTEKDKIYKNSKLLKRIVNIK